MAYSLGELEKVGILKPSDSVTIALTSQQEAFCQAYVFGGMTKTAAYRSVYDVGDTAQMGTVNGMAWRVSTIPHVRDRIDALYASRSKQSSLDTIRLRDIALNKIAYLAENGENEKIQFQAAVALSKMPAIGLYEKVGEGEEATGDTVIELKKLVERIKERMGEDVEEQPPSLTNDIVGKKRKRKAK